MTYKLPDLPYDYGALEPHYMGRMLELHHKKHHAGYVTKLNATLDRLETARANEDYTSIVGLEKSLAFNLAGHVLHSLFWKNLDPDGSEPPQGTLARAIDDDFGSFGAMRHQLTKATTTVQGSGWGALVWEPLGKRLVVAQIYDHHGNIGPGSIPLLVIDAWEHAFYLQFQNRKEEYIESIWNVLDWNEVQKRYDRASQFRLI